MDVDFREQVRQAISNLKWVEDVARCGSISAEETQEMAEIAEHAYVVLRILIRAGLAPADLWSGERADALWTRPASEWPRDVPDASR